MGILLGLLFSRLDVDSLVCGWLVGWLDGWLVGWLIGRQVDGLAGFAD